MKYNEATDMPDYIDKVREESPNFEEKCGRLEAEYATNGRPEFTDVQIKRRFQEYRDSEDVISDDANSLNMNAIVKDLAAAKESETIPFFHTDMRPPPAVPAFPAPVLN